MADLPAPVEATKSRRAPRYYVLQVHTIEADGDPGLISVISGPYIEFGNAWYSAGAIRRIYPDRVFIAGEMCSVG
jgi:hypothetical protein